MPVLGKSSISSPRHSKTALRTQNDARFCRASFLFLRVFRSQLSFSKRQGRGRLDTVEALRKAAGMGGTDTGLPRSWCRQEGINAAAYYRWERKLLAAVETVPCSSVPSVRFAEPPALKQVSRSVAEHSATLHIRNTSLGIYSGCDAEQLRMLVEFMRLA